MRSANRHRASRSLKRRPRRPEPHRLARALAGCGLLTLAAAPAAAQTAVLPSGLAVAAGAAQVATAGNRMTVTNTPQAILNWNSFSIGSAASVHFQQAAATSSVLNRVTGSDASNILGSLSSNGRVWLLNPNGILFGQGARVDVAGLVASTLRLSDLDWLAGRWNLGGAAAGAGSTASVVNQGELRTSFGGRVALVGGRVNNAGLVDAPGGQIVLAAGRSVELVDTGAPNLAVRINAPAGEARNLGALQAAGGRIDIHAASVNQQGIVSADTLTGGPGGEVWIKAGGAIELAAGSRTSADGGSRGGTLHVESDAGRSSLRGELSVQATQGVGGRAVLLGREVGVLGSARIDASGASGGGELLVGGGEQGADSGYANARAVYVGPEATLAADARDHGDGGRIVLWSDASTRAFGSFSVRGGAHGGDGGFVETSGGWLDARPALVDTRAARGRGGRWLLDPYDIAISDNVSSSGYDANYTATAESATIFSGMLEDALEAGTNVTVSTGGAGVGSQAGNITLFSANIVVAAAAPGNLTLLADGAITMTGSRIVALAGPQVVTLLAGRSGGGSVTLVDSTIDVSGESGSGTPLPGTRGIVIGGFASGELPLAGSFGGAAGGFGANGVTLDNSLLSAGGAGNVTISGVGGESAGIVIVNDSRLIGYDVELRGDSSDAGGVVVLGSSVNASHRLVLRGVGQDAGAFLGEDAQLLLDPSNPGDPGNGLLLQGRARSASDFVSVAIDGSESATLRALGGAPITVEAGDNGGNAFIFLGDTEAGSAAIDAAAGGLVTLRALGVGNVASADNGRIAILGATVEAGAAGVDIDTTGTLTLSGSIASAGPVRLSGYQVDLLSGASITSTSGGDAIVVAGHDDGSGRQLRGLTVEDSSIELATAAGGRWIVYATALSAVEGGALDALAYDFRQHDAAYGDWSAYPTGNGFVFGDPITASFSGSVTTRAYDGTLIAPVASASAEGEVGDLGLLRPGSTARYADANAGTGKPATFDSAAVFDFTDTEDRPVYGYTLTGSLTGTVTRADLTGVVTVADKVYDAGTVAQVGIGALSGLIGSETVGVGATGRFADKNVGSAKDVAATYTVADGSNGGLAANYRFISPLTLTASITPRPVAIGGLVVETRIYDGRTLAPVTGTATVVPLAGDSLALAGTATAAFNYLDRNVGTGKPVVVSGIQLAGSDANNYTLLSSTLTGTVTPRPLFIDGISVLDKVYDATTAATLSGSPLAAVLQGDQVVVSGTATASARFADKNAGTAKPVTVTGYTISGADAGNYAVLQPTGLAAAIRPLPVTLRGITANDKVYDASSAATLTGSATVATLAGDAVALAGAAVAAFADKNAGTAKPVTLSGYLLQGTDAGNYSLLPPTGLAATITPRPLAVAGIAADDKVYDAGVAATLSGSAGVATLAGDAVVLGGGAARFADKNAGSDKPVTVTGFALTGVDAANYSLAQPTGLVADITPRAASLTGLSAAAKVYDGDTAATLSGSASFSALPGDAVTLGGSAASANFLDKNVGIDKPVRITGYALSGADAANYSVSQPTGLVADITPRAVALAGIGAAAKVYDAGTAATLVGTASVATLAGDAVVVAGAPAARFADKNVGVDKPVSVTGYALAGADAANYSLSQPAALAADITPRGVSLTGLSAAGRVYDGGTTAVLSGSAGVATLPGDAVTLTGAAASANFLDKNVDIDKPVRVTGYALGGADAANYSVSQPSGLVASITPRAVTLTGLQAADKVYDAGTAATLVGSASIATLAGDAVSLAGTPAANFADANVGTAKPVAIGGVALAGADAGNYRFDGATAGFASIAPATLQYVAAPAVRGVGAALDGFAGQVSGFVGGETATTATSGTLSFATPAPAGSPAGRYALLGGGLVAANYRFLQAPDNAAALSIVDFAPSVADVVATENADLETLLRRRLPLAIDRSLTDSRVLVATAPAAAPRTSSPAGLPAASFAPVVLSSLSQDAIQLLLDSRALYMRTVLADATARLAANPAAADLAECETAAEAQQGTCLLTAKAKARLAAAPGAPPGAAAEPPPQQPQQPTVDTTGSAAAASSPAPAATGGAAASPSPAAAQPVPAAETAAPTPALDDAAVQRRRVRSAALPQIDRKIALMIGVDRYADPAIPSLANAVRDARAVGRVFEEKLGYEVITVADATRAKVVAALNRLALTLGPRDSVVVYYAGHGDLVEATGMGYWLLADSSAKQPETWLSNADISRSIAQMGALQVALVSDSCYSGSLATEERIRAAPTTLDPKTVLGRKSVVVMSSGGNEPVFDDGKDGHSPFAWNLMNTLNTVASWQAGGNVFERVRFAVARALPQRPQYSASRAAGHQSGGDYLFEQRQLEGERR